MNDHSTTPIDELRQFHHVASVKVLTILLAVGLCVSFLGLGSFGILDPSDGYYSEGAREMLESGDWVVPHFNYAPWFDKPILCYWLMAACYKLFGVSELVARIPSALFAGMMVPLSYYFASCFVRQRSALFGAAVLLSSPFWVAMGHLSLTDMTLTFFVWLATGCIALELVRKSWTRLIVGYVALGFGLLAKGPLALVLAGLFLVIFSAVNAKNLREFWSNAFVMKPFIGLLIAAIVAVPWYAAVSAATNGVFLQEFFLNQNLNRALGEVDHHVGPLYYFFYYIPNLIADFLPWTFFLIWGFGIAFARSLRAKRVLVPRSSRRSRFKAFALLCGLAVLAMFTALPTKLLTYILPCVPPLALYIGLLLDEALRIPQITAVKANRGLKIVLGLMALSGAVMLIGAIVKWKLLQPALAIVAIAFGAILMLGTLNYIRRPASKMFYALMLGTVCGVAAIVPLGLQCAYRLKCQDFHDLVQESVSRHLDPIIVGRRLPSAVFYLKHKLCIATTVYELIAAVDDGSDKEHVLITHGDMMNCLIMTGHVVKVIDTKGQWQLVSTFSKKSG